MLHWQTKQMLSLHTGHGLTFVIDCEQKSGACAASVLPSLEMTEKMNRIESSSNWLSVTVMYCAECESMRKFDDSFRSTQRFPFCIFSKFLFPVRCGANLMTKLIEWQTMGNWLLYIFLSYAWVFRLFDCSFANGTGLEVGRTKCESRAREIWGRNYLVYLCWLCWTQFSGAVIASKSILKNVRNKQ